jgi:hypothetical protein
MKWWGTIKTDRTGDFVKLAEGFVWVWILSLSVVEFYTVGETTNLAAYSPDRSWVRLADLWTVRVLKLGLFLMKTKLDALANYSDSETHSMYLLPPATTVLPEFYKKTISHQFSRAHCRDWTCSEISVSQGHKSVSNLGHIIETHHPSQRTSKIWVGQADSSWEHCQGLYKAKVPLPRCPKNDTDTHQWP